MSSLYPAVARRWGWALVPAATVLACLFGVTLAAGGIWQVVAVALAVAVAVIPPVTVSLSRRVPGWLAVELPIVLLVLSDLVWRQRTAESLAADPLDSAGLVRVAFVGLAAMLGAIACLNSVRSPGRRTPLPFRLYAAYVLVVFIGAPLSVNLFLTTYRGMELLAALLVVLGAWWSYGRDAIARMEATLYGSVVALITSVWIGFVLFPDRAIQRFLDQAPVPASLTGVSPIISSNGVGTLGTLLAVWSLARSGSRARYLLAGVGIATLLAAQYRTGYVALPLALAALLLVQHRWRLAALLLVIAILVVIWDPSIITQAEPFVLRGDTVQEASQLTGRVSWWQAALPVWQSSPLIGRGLLTGTRFEVLDRLGFGDTSSIHSTWVEALVGTGLIGLGLLLATYVTGLRAALVTARRQGWCVPLLLLIVLGVRSLTGPTFESFGQLMLLTLWAVLAAGVAALSRGQPDPASLGVSSGPRDRPLRAAAGPSAR